MARHQIPSDLQHEWKFIHSPEDLPPQYCDVLVVDHFGVLAFGKLNCFMLWETRGRHSEYASIVAWMPLPENPEYEQIVQFVDGIDARKFDTQKPWVTYARRLLENDQTPDPK